MVTTFNVDRLYWLNNWIIIINQCMIHVFTDGQPWHLFLDLQQSAIQRSVEILIVKEKFEDTKLGIRNHKSNIIDKKY